MNGTDQFARVVWAANILRLLTRGRSQPCLVGERSTSEPFHSAEQSVAAQISEVDNTDADSETLDATSLDEDDGRSDLVDLLADSEPTAQIKEMFLGCIAELLSPSHGARNVTATGMVENSNGVVIDVARNGGFHDAGDKDYFMRFEAFMASQASNDRSNLGCSCQRPNEFLSVTSTYQSARNIKPQLQLELPRRVSDGAQSIQFSMKGDINGLKRLFALGLASPRDESHSRGFSLLRWALYGGHSGMHHYEIVQFLLDQGAYVDNESYEIVGYFNLRKMYSDTDKKALRCIKRRDRNWFREQRFPVVHKIILGQSTKPLKDELLQNANAVSAVDTQGRSALDWATLRAQLDDMKLLITYGSNPNSMDISGRTTILHAVDSYNAEALRIILEAGAKPDPQIPKGLLRGSPLTSANLNGLPRMVELLLKFGAEINAPNPEGLTALHSAAISQNVECASILLQNGADIDYISCNGSTPFMAAITHNSHAVLRLFLSKYFSRLDVTQLLPIIAQNADSETISILASSNSFYLSEVVDIPTCRGILFFRKDNNEELTHAFENLVSIYTGAGPLSTTPAGLY